MNKHKCLLMVVADNGRYEKTIELPFVPQIGMTIFRSGNPMWDGLCADLCHAAPKISGVGYDLDEGQFEVEIHVDQTIKLTSTFWDNFIPL